MMDRNRFGLRASVTLLGVFLGFGAFIGQSSAQYYPPYPPSPYGGGYRAAPMPDDDDDVGPPPSIYSRPPAATPSSPGPYPPSGSSRSYDPRYGEVESDPLPPPNAYGRGAGVYSTRPDDGLPPVRPPGALDPARSPTGVGSNQTPVDLTPNGAAVPNGSTNVASLPADYLPEEGQAQELPENLRRQLISYPSTEPAGTILIDTPHTYLYLILGNGRALRYGIGVGREGFTWAGVERISRIAEWPDWIPPKEMIERQPYLPRFMAGGPSNPLGARALYLGNSLYRIHGTNQPSTIGSFVSSGCIRLTNEDIEDLYRRVQVGTRVVVLPGSPPATASAAH
jgi:lipoprotein-anchoring transpeptidase ErfK/SrfK